MKIKIQRRIFSLLFALCLLFTSWQVDIYEVYAGKYDLDGDNDWESKQFTDDKIKYVENISEGKVIFNTEDSIYSESGNNITVRYKGIQQMTISSGTLDFKFIEYEGATHWLITSISTDRDGDYTIDVYPYNEIKPNVYIWNGSKYLNLILSDTPDENGMVKCLLSDGTQYKNLDISVSQYVYPIYSESSKNKLKITINSNNTDFDMSKCFYYYKSTDETANEWGTNDDGFHVASKGLETIGSAEGVDIYIKEKDNSLVEATSSVESGKGSISPEGLSYIAYDKGDSDGKKEYTITPENGWYLEKLEVGGTSENIPTPNSNSTKLEYTYTIGPNITTDTTLKVSFKKLVEAQVNGNTGGKFYNFDGTNYKELSQDGYIAEYGKDFTIYLKPDDGYKVKKFAIAEEPSTTTVSLEEAGDGYFKYTIDNVTSSKNVTVEFEKIYKVKVSYAEGNDYGNIFRVVGSTREDATQKEFEYSDGTASEKYYFENDGGLLVSLTDNDEEKIGSLKEDTLSGITYKYYKVDEMKKDHKLVATFVKESKVSTSVVNSSGGKITGKSSVLANQDYDYEIVPDTGYGIKKLTDNDDDVTSKIENGKYTISKPTEDHTIEVEFKKLKYKINATVKDGIGTIIRTTATGEPSAEANAEYEEEVTYKITPETGYEIKQVTDNGEEVIKKVINGEYKIKVTERHTIEVEFKKLKYGINATVKDNVGGTIIRTDATGEPSTEPNVEYEEEVIYKITPETGYEIKQVTDNGEEVIKKVINGEYKITVTESHTIEVEFKKLEYSIDVTVKGNIGGSIKGTGSAEYGDEVTYTITPYTGYKIKKVTDNGEEVTEKVENGEYKVKVTESHTIEVEFKKLEYSITVKGNIGGEIKGTERAEYGEEVTCTITPYTGYKIKKVTDNGEEVTEKVLNGEYKIKVTESHTIEVEFEKLEYSIDVTVKGNIGGEIKGTERAEYGDEVTCTITPYMGYTIKKVTDNGEEVTEKVENGEYKVKVTENHTIEVEFSKITYAINVVVKNSVGGSITGKSPAEYGDELIYTITPETGYEIKKVTDNGTEVTAQVINGKYKITVTEDHTLIVEFEKIKQEENQTDDEDSQNDDFEDEKFTIPIYNIDVVYEKLKDGTIKVDLTDKKLIKKILEKLPENVLELDFSSILSSKEPLELNLSGSWFDKDGTIKGISVKGLGEIFINDSMLKNYNIKSDDVITITIKKGSIIVDMKINGVSVSEVDRKNQLKIDYGHNLGKNADENNTVAVEILADGTQKVLPFAMLKENDTKTMTILTPKFGEFEVVLKNTKEFTDIGKNYNWAKDSIEFVTAREIFAGTSENTFSPEMKVTRGMFVTIIGRLYGVDEEYKLIFTDVDKNAYYANYVAWASANGIVNGTGNGKFEPDREITRQEMAVIFANYINFIGYDMNEVEEKIMFSDNSDIASWAADAIELMQKTDILNGTGNNEFTPKGTATRAEAAAAITNFIKNIVKTYSAEANGKEVL